MLATELLMDMNRNIEGDIMRTAFTQALYYPHIDIENSDWLKTAVLFWDSISTIVPESVRNPYKHRDSEYLASIDFLRPIHVNSDDEAVVGIEDDIFNTMFTPSFFAMLSNPRHMRNYGISHDKMSYRLRELFESGIHVEKMSWEIRHRIQEYGDIFRRDNVLYMDDSFAYLYMVTLANKICENRSIALVASDSQSESVANILRLDNQLPLPVGYENHRIFHRRRNFCKERHYEQGIMLDLIINGLRISPDVPLVDIVTFKERHKDELRTFRVQLNKLVQEVPQNQSLEAIQQTIRDVYDNEFLREYNEFIKALKSSKIKWFADSLVKISAVTASATGIPMILGATVPQALLAGAGVSMLASIVSYNVDKRQYLNNNPYSFLLASKRELR